MMARQDRFIAQARKDYLGSPNRIAWSTDKYGEKHVVIEMIWPDGQKYYLDWIGAEYADQPDEFGETPPDGTTLIFKPIKG